MTTIAWDGKTLAADKQMTNGTLRGQTTKIRRVGGEVLAWTGDQDSGEALAAWYEAGADPARWPSCQKDKDAWARLIVARPAGVFTYEREPVAVRIENPFFAWGSGRDFAIAAMHCGRSACEAVELASLYDTASGMGIDACDVPTDRGSPE